jgi:hypothetical protein
MRTTRDIFGQRLDPQREAEIFNTREDETWQRIKEIQMDCPHPEILREHGRFCDRCGKCGQILNKTS